MNVRGRPDLFLSALKCCRILCVFFKAGVVGTGRIGESATDHFPPAATGVVCLFSYLSSAVNQEERRRET